MEHIHRELQQSTLKVYAVRTQILTENTTEVRQLNEESLQFGSNIIS